MPSPRLTVLLAGIIVVSSGLNAPFALAQTPFTPSPVPGFTPAPSVRPPTNQNNAPPLGQLGVVPVLPPGVVPNTLTSVGFGYTATPVAPPTLTSTNPGVAFTPAPVFGLVPTPAVLKQTITVAARTAVATPGFAAMSAAQKNAVIQAAIARAMASSGATPAVIGAALALAVADNSISGATAVAVASAVSPTLGAQVAALPAVAQNIAQAGIQNVTTSSISTVPTFTALTPLQAVLSTLGSTTFVGTTLITLPPPAPFDPCAGVIAAYCGG